MDGRHISEESGKWLLPLAQPKARRFSGCRWLRSWPHEPSLPDCTPDGCEPSAFLGHVQGGAAELVTIPTEPDSKSVVFARLGARGG